MCVCKNEYSLVSHGNGYALMFASCPHRHGYNLANIADPDMPMIETMLHRLFHIPDLKEKDVAQQNEILRLSGLLRVREKEITDYKLRLICQDELVKENERPGKAFDHLAASIGWTQARCDQTGDSPFSVAKELKAQVLAGQGER